MNTLMMNPASAFIMSGQSRESLAGFMLSAGKTVAILTVASGIGADSSSINQARNVSPATASGSSPNIDQQTQAYGALTAASGGRTYVEIATNAPAGSQAVLPVAGSGGGSRGSTSVASSNTPAQSLAAQGGTPSATGGQGGGSAITGTRTASTGGDNYNQIRQGSQHPTKGHSMKRLFKAGLVVLTLVWGVSVSAQQCAGGGSMDSSGMCSGPNTAPHPYGSNPGDAGGYGYGDNGSNSEPPQVIYRKLPSSYAAVVWNYSTGTYGYTSKQHWQTVAKGAAK